MIFSLLYFRHRHVNNLSRLSYKRLADYLTLWQLLPYQKLRTDYCIELSCILICHLGFLSMYFFIFIFFIYRVLNRTPFLFINLRALFTSILGSFAPLSDIWRSRPFPTVFSINCFVNRSNVSQVVISLKKHEPQFEKRNFLWFFT